VIPELVARYQHSQALIQLGTAPYLAPSQQLLNRAVTITPKGLLTQDKLFLTPWEQYQGFNASDTIIIGDFQGYRFCVLICFDSEVAQLSAFLRPYHLDLVIVPAATETIYGCHRVHRGGSARAMELGSALLVSQLTGTLQNLDLVNDNCGRSGLYLPAQPPLTLKEISQYSPIIYQGLLVAQYTLPLAQIRSLRHISDETNPALTSSKPNISVIELS
jgi:predicted amidohydrolase